MKRFLRKSLKKTLSVLLATIMLVGTCVSLIVPTVATTEEGTGEGTSTASGANGAGVLASWNFDDTSLTGLKDNELLTAIGWEDMTGSASVNASTEDGALRLRNSAKTNYYLQVLENTNLKDAFVLEYDFKYATPSGSYNSIQDGSGGFYGNTGKNSHSASWAVQPRLNGLFLNAPQTSSGWIGSAAGSTVAYSDYAALNGGTGASGSVNGSVLNTWFTVRIEYSPDYNVTASIKLKNGTTWVTESYNAYESATAETSSTAFVTKYLRFNVYNYADVYLDNIVVRDTLPALWDFEDSSLTGLTNDSLLTTIGWKDLSETSNLTSTIVTETDGNNVLHLNKNANAGANYFLQVLESEDLKNSFTIEYDFKYGTSMDSAGACAFAGAGPNDSTPYNNTWQVQPRANGSLLNGVRTDAWLDLGADDFYTSFSSLANPLINQWFTMKIEYSPDYVVKASMKLRGGSTWTVVDTYTATETSGAASCTGFISRYLRINLYGGNAVDVYLDNVSVTKSFPAQWDFDDASLDGLTGDSALNAIGWTSLSTTEDFSASVGNGTLRLSNSSATRQYLQVAQGAELKEAYILEYDFMYSTDAAYQTDPDAAGYFMGGARTDLCGTWHVEPRVYGGLLNAPKTGSSGNGSWVDTSRYTSNVFGDATTADITADSTHKETGKWFSVKIEYSPSGTVTAYIKLKGAESWQVTDSYSEQQITSASAATQCPYFVSSYLRFEVGPNIDIYLDNVSIRTSEYFMDFNAAASTNGANLIPELGWSFEDNTATGFNASVSTGALNIRNYSYSTNYFRVHESEALKGAYVLQYDFMYGAPTKFANSLQNTYVKTKDANGNPLTYYSKYNERPEQSGSFLGGTGMTPGGTWSVQPRLSGGLLNAPKTDKNDWVSTGRLSASSNRFGTVTQDSDTGTNAVTEQWFNVKIEYFPGSMVKVYLKAKGATEWQVTDVYDQSQIAAASGTQQFVSNSLRFTVGLLVNVYIDNLSIVPVDYIPELYGVQYSNSYLNTENEPVFDMRMIATTIDDDPSEVGFIVVMDHYSEAEGKIKHLFKEYTCQHDYESLTYTDADGSEITIYANQMREGMSRIFALYVTGIPMSETYTYHVIPFEVRNGQRLYGTAKTFTRSIPQERLPDYATAAGVDMGYIEFTAGGYFTKQIVGSTVAELNTYVTTLTTAGYTLYQSRDNVNGNYFRTLYNDDMMVHLYFMPAANTCGDFSRNVVRIVVTDANSWVPYRTTALPMDESNPEVTEASAAFMSVDNEAQGTGNANGLGMVFTNPDGSYVIMDGAWDHDTTALYNYLKENNKRTDGKIIIRAWIITHPHEDHWGNIVEFGKRYMGTSTEGYNYNDGTIVVENLVVQLHQQYTAVNSNYYKLIRTTAANLGAGTIVAQTGQIMYFGQLEVEFLYTLETMLTPANVDEYLLTGGSDSVDGNEQSLIFRGRFDGGDKTVLITGDATQRESAHAEAMYGTHLRSDIVTLPHHGIDPTTETFYTTNVQPKYVLYATNRSAAWARYTCSMTSKLHNGEVHWGTPQTGGASAVNYAWSIGGETYTAEDDQTFTYLKGYKSSYVIFYMGAGLIEAYTDDVQWDSVSCPTTFS